MSREVFKAILEQVSNKWGVRKNILMGDHRQRHVARARRELLVRAHLEAGLSFASLARVFNKSHVSIQKSIEQGMRELIDWS